MRPVADEKTCARRALAVDDPAPEAAVRTPAHWAAEVRRRYAALIDLMIREGRAQDAARCARLAADQGVWADPAQRPIDYEPDGSHQPVYPSSDFWFTGHLTAHHSVIRAEVDTVTDPARHGFRAVEETLLAGGRWDQVILYESGVRQDDACASFPALTEVVEQIPEATTFGPGVVSLSWLHPGTRIIPHCGRTNGRLRVHLGVRTPDGATLRVGSEQLSWSEGACLVFDDSFEHEVRHDGTEPRVVLLLDVPHPALAGRVLRDRRSDAARIAAFLAEQNLVRVERDDRGVVLRPNEGVDALVQRYLAKTGARAVELRSDGLHFEY